MNETYYARLQLIELRGRVLLMGMTQEERLQAGQSCGILESRANPYHDPATGRFTSGPGGMSAGAAAKVSSDAEKGTTSRKRTSETSDNTVDLEYIHSDNYRRKFKGLTGNESVDTALLKYAQAILTHRSKTDREDMYLIDSKTGKVAGKQASGTTDFGVDYNDSLKKAVSAHPPKTLISLHNHPTNYPPTGSDLISAGTRQYKMGIVVCHDGKVYRYSAGKPFHVRTFDAQVDKFVSQGYNKNEAIIKTLTDFERDYGIEWSEAK